MARKPSNFAGRAVISWHLVRSSAVHLRANTDLLIYPIVSAFLAISVMAVFAISVFAYKGFDVNAVRNSTSGFRFVVTFLFYLVLYFVTYFANTALIGAVLSMMDGERPTIRDSLGIAWERIVSIFGYALVMATVGMFFKWLYGRGGIPSRLLGPVMRRVLAFGILGLGWHLVTFLVVPVLVVENVGPIEAVKRSASLVKETWGEQIVGNTSIWLIFSAPIVLFALLAAPLLFVALRSSQDMFTIVVLYGFVMVIVTLLLVQMALQGIFSAAVYRYATGQHLDEEFDESVLRNAFQQRPDAAVSRLRNRIRRGIKSEEPAEPVIESEEPDLAGHK